MSAPLLRVENLTWRENPDPLHPGPVRTPAFERVSFDIAEGAHVAVVGAPGSGKTALARAVALLEKSRGGKVYLEGRDITRLWGGQLRALRQRLQFVGGDPMRTLPPHYTVEQTLIEPLQIHRLGSADEQRARVTAMSEWFRLNPLLLTRKVSMLSAAMRQRVALARALTLHPRLLVCDELTDRIEPSAAQPLLAMVARACRASRGPIAWLWTTSDRALARAFADHVLLLEDGQLVAD